MEEYKSKEKGRTTEKGARNNGNAETEVIPLRYLSLQDNTSTTASGTSVIMVILASITPGNTPAAVKGTACLLVLGKPDKSYSGKT